MPTVMGPQQHDLGGIVVATSVLLMLCVCIVVMMRSRRPDGKFLLLSRLISASERNSRRRMGLRRR